MIFRPGSAAWYVNEDARNQTIAESAAAQARRLSERRAGVISRAMEKKKYTRPELLTTPEELKAKLGNQSLRVIDTRQAEIYAQGHIPGAIHFDLFGISLIDTSPAPLTAFMSMIAHLFELRGVNLDTEVVFYEENSGM